jgi:hypothetical protein
VLHPLEAIRTRRSAGLALAIVATVSIAFAGVLPADAAIVPTVGLGTAGSYSVLAGSTITNTGPTTLSASMGLAPGTAITGFPPGTAAGSTDVANPVAVQAKSDLTAGYLNAAGRSLNATTTADLANLTLVGGVYAGPGKAALSLSGPLVLDGEGNADSVFIFQTDSTLTTASASSVSLINGAQACNVFWQVGSSATLGTGSSFTGTILALTSITVTTSVTINGRVLARNGAVTLDTDSVVSSACAPQQVTTTTSTTPSTTTTTGSGPSTTTTSVVGGGTTTSTVVSGGVVVTTTTVPGGSSTQTELPRTGSSVGVLLWVALIAIVLGTGTLAIARRHGVPIS